MRFGFVCVENVHDFNTACFQKIGNQRAVTAPPNRFCAHDRSRPHLVRNVEKPFSACAKFFGFHVIGISAK